MQPCPGVHVNVWTMNTPPTPTFDPWDACRRLGITVRRTPLSSGRGYTNGSLHIWLHDTLTPAEEIVTVTHELVHITQGHCGRQPAEVEELVRRVTARWLVPWPAVVAGWGARVPFDWIAGQLGLTPEVVIDRVAHATCEELLMLEALCASLAA